MLFGLKCCFTCIFKDTLTGAKVLFFSPRHSQSALHLTSIVTRDIFATVAVILPLSLALSSQSLDSSFSANLEGFKPTRVIVLLILRTFQGLVSPIPSLNTDLEANQDLRTIGR